GPREAEGKRIALGDAQRGARAAADACDVPDEVAAALGIAQRERAALRLEVVERPPHQAAEGPARWPLATEGGRELEHEAELALRPPLVLAQVADQVSDDQQVDRPEEMH